MIRRCDTSGGCSWPGWRRQSVCGRRRLRRDSQRRRRCSRSSRPCSTPSITIRPSARRSSRSTRRPPASRSRNRHTCHDSILSGSRTAATVNNIFGQVLPQSVIPAMSGPVLDSASGGQRLGQCDRSAVLLGAVRFRSSRGGGGGRRSGRGPLAGRRGAHASRRPDRRRRGLSQHRRRAARRRRRCSADVDRRELLSRAVHTLVDNQLRPGAEASRSDAERAAAQTRLIQAQQAVTLGQISLARVLGVTTGADHDRRDGPPGSTSGRCADGFFRRRRIRWRRSSRRRSTSPSAGTDLVADGSSACVCPVQRVRSRERGEPERAARWRILRPRSRPRQLGGRCAGGVPQRLRLLQPACA